jgi:hypothetical protein
MTVVYLVTKFPLKTCISSLQDQLETKKQKTENGESKEAEVKA